jgi:sulfate adenylyltransferase
LARKHEHELGLKLLTFQQVVYVEETGQYMEEDKVPEGLTVKNISGTELRKRLRQQQQIPAWFSFPGVLEILQQRARQSGFTIFFTGLSGAGKSSLANALSHKLMELSTRTVSILDGDHVRKMLSSELGFSREHRKLNVLRVGFVASQITKAGGIALVALIAPYEEDRKQVRQLVSNEGGFMEIYMSTPLEVCESRDIKGLYQKARSGLIRGVTGIDDPYEAPTNPELSLDSSKHSIAESVALVVGALQKQGFLT